MTSTENQSCCTIVPAADSGKYQEAGQWTDFEGLKAYTTGSENATSGLLFIYDIFGYTPQTLQGADILAKSSLEPIVVVPDLFNGQPMKMEWYASKTEENQGNIKSFMTQHANPSALVLNILSNKGLMASLKAEYPKVTSWGVIGYCWGGKIAALTSGKGTPFKCAIQTSPALLDPSDAATVEIPMAVLASKDENAAAVEEYEKALKGQRHVETWEGSVHGWMSARADLSDSKQKKEYERGYKVAIDFFHKFL